jgi:hypothetical protein
LHVRQKRTITVAVVMALIGTVFATVLSPASPASAALSTHTCVNSLGAYSPFEQELTPLELGLSAPDPVAVAGEQVTLSGAQLTGEVTEEFYLALYRGRERGNYMLLDVGENTWPLYAWVAIEGTNTVEGVQTVYVEGTYSTTITDPTPFIDPETGEVRTDISNYLGRTSGDESAAAPDVVVNLPATTWTPAGAGPVSFAEAAPGNISFPVDTEVGTPGPEWDGPAPIPQPEGTIHIDGTSTHNMNTNPYWVKPYGSIFVRLHTISSAMRPETGTNTNGYGANLDCVPGAVEVNVPAEGETVPGRNAHGAFEPGTELAGWTTKVVDGEEITGPDLMVNGGSLGRYAIVEADRPAFAETAFVPTGSHACINSLGSYGPFSQELTPLTLDLSAPDASALAGEPLTLSGTQLTGEVAEEFYLALYRGRERGNYMLLDVGENTWPVYTWVAIEGTNTVEGVQTVYVEGTYSTTITDPTPFIDPETGDVRTDISNYLGRTSGDESATNPNVVIDLPDSVWTPTGEGPVAFSEGPPGSISLPVDTEVGTLPPGYEGPTPIPQPEGTIHIDGTSTHNMNTNPYWVKPYGSVFLRLHTISSTMRPETGTNTNGYGANLDCLAGDLSVVAPAEGETVPGRNAHGGFEPGTELTGWTTAVIDGEPVTGPELMVNGGSLGRYDIDEAERPVFAEGTILPAVEFSDVPEGHPFFAEISWLASSGIAEGYPDGTFGPANPVSRQAMAAFLYRLAGEPAFEVPLVPTFDDVPTDHPFYVPIEWLAETGISEGFGDGTFMPADDISRQAIGAFIYRFDGEPPFEIPSEASFSDVPTSHAFFAEIEWLYETGLSEGYPDGTFHPDGDTTRQATAAFLYRYVQLDAVG